MYVSAQQISGLRARGSRIASEVVASRAAMSNPAVAVNAKPVVAPLMVRGSKEKPIIQARFGRTIDVRNEQGVLAFLSLVKNRSGKLAQPIRLRIDDLIAERRRQAAVGIHTAQPSRRDDRGAR